MAEQALAAGDSCKLALDGSCARERHSFGRLRAALAVEHRRPGVPRVLLLDRIALELAEREVRRALHLGARPFCLWSCLWSCRRRWSLSLSR